MRDALGAWAKSPAEGVARCLDYFIGLSVGLLGLPHIMAIGLQKQVFQKKISNERLSVL